LRHAEFSARPETIDFIGLVRITLATASA